MVRLFVGATGKLVLRHGFPAALLTPDLRQECLTILQGVLMKNLCKTIVLAGVVAVAATSGAYAKEHPRPVQQQRIDQNTAYWNDKNAEPSKQAGERQASDGVPMPNVSEYPCGGCVYNSDFGGYMQKAVRKH